MSIIKLCGPLLTALILISAARPVAQSTAPVEQDIRYAKDADSQVLDLYLPAKKNFTTIVYTYGGGWHSGSGKSSKPIAEKLQSLGYGCALVSHRLSPPYYFPAHAQDLAAAFAWVKSNIAARGGDPRRLVLAGHSSGAHLSLLIATDPKYLAAYNLKPSDIAAVIGLSTPVNLSPMAGGHGYGDALLGGHGADAFKRDVELMKDASPTNHLSRELPPTLLLVGQQDFPMLEGDCRDFAAKAQALGRKVEFAIIPGKNHMSMALGMTDDTDPVLVRVLSFLKEHPGN
jgi:acetyl esterase/lipase